MKKIAVIGGNLLGCATTLDLALIEEHDRRVFGDSAEKISVTLYEKSDSLGGNGFKSITIDDDISVEVGSYRTVPLPPGTYLTDLVSAANDGLGTISLGNLRIPIPGANRPRRGRRDAAEVSRLWRNGTYGRVVRSFAAWDWEKDEYYMIHEGWPLLDWLHSLLRNEIWRSVALFAALWSVRKLTETSGIVPRAMMLAQIIALLAVFIFSPKNVVASWQRNYTFWGTTLQLLWKHGITAAIARGGSIGFQRHIANINIKNYATCSISIGNLLERTGLEPYVRSSGDDYVRKFKYDREYVNRYISPIVSWANGGKSMTELSSLSSHFAMMDSDFSNSDVENRVCTFSPSNHCLCEAILEAAQSSMDVEIKIATKVTEIMFSEASNKYKVSYGENSFALFDGIVLCASPEEGELIIKTPLGDSISHLLGYEKDILSSEEFYAQEEKYKLEKNSESVEEDKNPVSPSACSHFGVVIGVAKPQFFRMTKEKRIPDLVQITNSPSISRFERLKEVDKTSKGVYTVLCGADFESGGLLTEMFEEGYELKFFEKVTGTVYSHSPIPSEKDVDECFPGLVIGKMFIYAAATDKLAKHPEMDAISAVNAASLFSKAVLWESEDSEMKEEEKK